jgi:RNA polymerase sigma-70 factor (ECF subfamily)
LSSLSSSTRITGRVCRYLAARVPRDAVEDAAAETFLVAWRRLDELPAPPLGWLLRTASMCSRNQRRTLVRSAALAGATR